MSRASPAKERKFCPGLITDLDLGGCRSSSPGSQSDQGGIADMAHPWPVIACPEEKVYYCISHGTIPISVIVV